MSEVTCTNGHVVNTGADHCQRCNVKIISPNPTIMEETNTSNPENVEESPTDEILANTKTDVEESTTDTAVDGDAAPTV